MKNIKSFNEAKLINEQRIYSVILEDREDFGADLITYLFSTEMLAYDFIIKYFNNYLREDGEDKFEPFYDKDGGRFFLSIQENEDVDRCISYIEERCHIRVSIEDGILNTKPIKDYED